MKPGLGLDYSEDDVRRIAMEGMQRTVQACLQQWMSGAKPWVIDTQGILDTLIEQEKKT